MPPRLWDTVDRWGPAAVSIVTLLAVIAIGWMYSERTAHLEGEVSSLQHQVDVYGKIGIARDDDIDTLRNWIIAVYERGSAHGWDMPELPEIEKLKAQQRQKGDDNGNQEAPVQRPR